MIDGVDEALCQRPAVSIITVFHNRSAYVQSSINSILEQTFKNFELIIIDDGSTDDTRDKISNFEDQRIKPIFQKNLGFTESLLKAINVAKGDFIAIHGSGDISLPTRIEKQYKLINSSCLIGVVGCWVENVWPDGRRNIRDIVDISQPFSRLLQKECIFTHGEVMYRRSAYDNVGGYRSFFEFSQDYDLWFRMSEYYNFEVVPEVLYHRYSPPNTIRANPSKMLIQFQLSELARQSAIRRQNGYQDIVDQFGPTSLSQMKRSKRLGDILVGTGAHIVTRQNNPDGHILINAGMLHAPTSINKIRKLIADYHGSRIFSIIGPLLKLRRLALDWRKGWKQRQRSRSA